MSVNAPHWLTARPIAHRGLHDARHGIIENSLSAAKAAIAKNFAIECDVQLSGDGVPMVFHDYTLDRLTSEKGRLDAHSAMTLSGYALGATTDRIPRFSDLLACVAQRAPVICEIKSRFDGDMRLARATARCAAEFGGPIALKSFDSAVIAHLRANAAALGIERVPLGMVAQASYDDPHDEWAHLPASEKRALQHFLHWRETRPDFLSWSVWNLPHATPFLCRAGLGLPVMTWTVRFPDQVVVALEWADQIIFEGDIGL